MAGENPFKAAWSRGGNLLCHGHWIMSWQNPPRKGYGHLGNLFGY